MADDREGGELVLRTATAVAREVLGEHLDAVFALGSLAHGGFAPLASDVDVAVILDALLEDVADRMAEIRRATVARAGGPLAERLSVFWSDWHGVRHGAGERSRLPAVDRLDLLDAGRLLYGADRRGGAARPDRTTLVVEAARFAVEKFDDAYLAGLHRPEDLVAAGPRAASKAALFPIRFLYTLASGRMGHNDAAATWYGHEGAHAPLAHAAMRWRESGIDDRAAAVEDLRAHLVGVYVEFVDAYAPALADAGHDAVADALLDRRGALLAPAT
ncbi:hypothetical protein LWC33_15995 [Pseudonocardia sp. RS11V-5]|uniref:hypothetical protein n=1 Tax=Pseudonocardia terrae TaxID=2905831 RepID=UPI001E575B0A|nr:hypothetical protein [Pseudonocardia terrae]MCE3552952.1 hypothetical protein [Pseudonocardia terrae]